MKDGYVRITLGYDLRAETWKDIKSGLVFDVALFILFALFVHAVL